MPYTVTSSTLPCGARCLRVEGSGVISKEDAEYLITFIGRNGSMYGVPFLLLAQQIKSFSPEARTLFGSGFSEEEKQTWTAMVTTSPLIRVASNFMTRVSGHRRLKMFGSEEDAIRWLDEHVRANMPESKDT